MLLESIPPKNDAVGLEWLAAPRRVAGDRLALGRGVRG